MNMQVSEADGVSWVRLEGRLDIEGAQAVDLRFSTLAGSAAAMAVDLSGVSFLASMGVRTLMLSAKTMRRRGARIVVFGANENVDKVLRVTGFDEIVTLYPDHAAAAARAGLMIARAFEGTLAGAAQAEEWASEQGELMALPEATRFALGLCVEELFVNAVTHGRALRVRLALNGASLEFRDDGAPFDPTRAPVKRLDGAEDFEIGGFGTGLVQKFARTLSYSRDQGWNVVRLGWS